MKKFYKIAEAGTAPNGYAVRLDGKLLKTPLNKPLLLPTLAAAKAIADEWQSQGDELLPHIMPITQLANTMIDKSAGDDRAAMNEMLLEYGSSDLICYFATHPNDLVERQKKHWQPLVEWMAQHHKIIFKTIAGIQYQHQPKESIVKLGELITALDPLDFTVVQSAAASTGSVAIGLALLNDRLNPNAAYEAACVDEIYQLEKWGEDAEALKRLHRIEADLKAIIQFRDLFRATHPDNQ